MVKPTFRGWRKPPPMLVFMLAVMVPAAALIIAGVFWLRHLQRDEIIDAAIQRDYQHMLKIAEKRIVEHAYETSERASLDFPDVDHPEEIDAFLTNHPEITHAFLWTGKGNLDFRSQTGRMSDPEFQAEHKEMASELGHVLDMWSSDHIDKIKKNGLLEGRRLSISSESVSRGDKILYVSFVSFLPRGSSHEHPALAGFVYDED